MTPSSPLRAALTCARHWRWPVVPAAPRAGGGCGCPDPGCVVPGAHPLDPVLLAATTDERMVRFWWTARPGAGVVLATGGRAPCGVSLPASAAACALAEFDRTGVRVGPVLAGPTRWTLLVAPYALPQLGELLYAAGGRVPSSLRFHGEGGYVALPPTASPAAPVRWERPPVVERGGDGSEGPWLPRTEDLLGVLLAAGANAPDTGSRLRY